MENKRSVKESCGELISPRAAADIAGVSMNTLREWDKKGLIDSYRTDGGHRRYSLDSLRKHLERLRSPNVIKESIIYASIATEKEESELNVRLSLMKDFCLNRNWDCRVITDVGYGLSSSQKGILELVGLIESNKVERLIVDGMDNVINLSFDIIKEICKWHNVDITVVSNVESYRRKNMKEFRGLSEAMIFDLKQELRDYFEHFDVEFDEVENDDWVTVINNADNTVLTQNKNGDSHLLSFKRFVYNENYVSGSLELRINDEQKETGYIIFNRYRESADTSKYDKVIDLWHATRAYLSLNYLEFECKEEGIMMGIEDRLVSIVRKILGELTVNEALFHSVEEFVDLLSVCSIDQYDIEGILGFMLDDDFILEVVEDDGYSDGTKKLPIASELALRALNCVRS